MQAAGAGVSPGHANGFKQADRAQSPALSRRSWKLLSYLINRLGVYQGTTFGSRAE